MTDQIPDQFSYEGKNLEILEIIGDEVLTPKDFGIVPIMKSTSSYNGYAMRYVIKNKKLILDGFWVGVEKGTIPPPINDIVPIKLTRIMDDMSKFMCNFFTHEYRDLNYTMDFTGSIRAENSEGKFLFTIVNGDIIEIETIR